MNVTKNRLAVTFVVFLVWLAITTFFMRLIEPVDQQSLDAMVSARIGPQFVAAIVFLFGAIFLFGWRDMGFSAPQPTRSLLLLWFPAIYLVLFFGAALQFGLPAQGVILIVFLNTCMVGLSEELACRGVLLQGLRSRMSVWPAVMLSSALFGVIHVLNGFLTGDFAGASTQAIAAFMSGVLFAAIRLRTHSLYPGIVFHALWDFGTFLMVLSMAQQGDPGGPGSVMAPFFPILLVLPNFLYGLFLLRHAGREERNQAIA